VSTFDSRGVLVVDASDKNQSKGKRVYMSSDKDKLNDFSKQPE